ncbi:DUF2333 family protein [Sulfurospirillum sp. 1307]|jgi:hypothetical protein
MKDFLIDYLFDFNEWKIFFKRLFSLVALIVVSFLLWLFPISLIVAPFYSITTDTPKQIVIYKDVVGKTTVSAIKDGLAELVDEGLVTNFTGVNFWIDNKYFEQVGEIEMYRIAINTLENNLARNRGTGGANKYIVQARSDIYADYTLPIFTSYTTRLKQSIKSLDKYLSELEKDQNKPMEEKNAVFIVNSDNLAEVLDKIKQQLQTNIMIKTSFLSQDDKYYRIKGNLLAMQRFLEGINYDFKDKMIDKTSYEENFLPLLALIKSSIKQNHIVILESFGHLSKLEKNANLIAQKLGELRDKLRNG